MTDAQFLNFDLKGVLDVKIMHYKITWLSALSAGFLVISTRAVQAKAQHCATAFPTNLEHDRGDKNAGYLLLPLRTTKHTNCLDMK